MIAFGAILIQRLRDITKNQCFHPCPWPSLAPAPYPLLITRGLPIVLGATWSYEGWGEVLSPPVTRHSPCFTLIASVEWFGSAFSPPLWPESEIKPICFCPTKTSPGSRGWVQSHLKGERGWNGSWRGHASQDKKSSWEDYINKESCVKSSPSTWCLGRAEKLCLRGRQAKRLAQTPNPIHMSHTTLVSEFSEFNRKERQQTFGWIDFIRWH